jgi:hypothetical protein
MSTKNAQFFFRQFFNRGYLGTSTYVVTSGCTSYGPKNIPIGVTQTNSISLILSHLDVQYYLLSLMIALRRLISQN